MRNRLDTSIQVAQWVDSLTADPIDRDAAAEILSALYFEAMETTGQTPDVPWTRHYLRGGFAHSMIRVEIATMMVHVSPDMIFVGRPIGDCVAAVKATLIGG